MTGLAVLGENSGSVCPQGLLLPLTMGNPALDSLVPSLHLKRILRASCTLTIFLVADIGPVSSYTGLVPNVLSSTTSQEPTSSPFQSWED